MDDADKTKEKEKQSGDQLLSIKAENIGLKKSFEDAQFEINLLTEKLEKSEK